MPWNDSNKSLKMLLMMVSDNKCKMVGVAIWYH